MQGLVSSFLLTPLDSVRKAIQSSNFIMPKFLIVVCHAEPKSMCSSLGNEAIAALTAAGHEVKVTRIYEDGFNPLTNRKSFTTTKDSEFFKPQMEELYASEHGGFEASLEEEIQKVEWCDVLVFQFPLYWFHLPAGLKGWVDRVFAFGRVYAPGKVYDSAPFGGKKKAVLSMTTGGPKETYEADGFNGDLNGILRPIHRGIFEFCGFRVLAPQVSYSPARITPEERAAQLASWTQRVVGLFDEEPIVVGRYV